MEQINTQKYNFEPIKLDKKIYEKTAFLVVILLLIFFANRNSNRGEISLNSLDGSLTESKIDFTHVNIEFTKAEHIAILQGLDYCLLDDYRLAPETIGNISHREFEGLAAYLYFRKSHKVFLTPATRDKGKDFIGEYSKSNGKKVKYFAECKHYTAQKVGTPAVQKLFGAMRMDKVPHGIIITFSRFSSDAQKMVKEYKLPIELVDKDGVIKMLFEPSKFDEIS